MSVTKGNAGEHLVMAELLARGFDAYWADRGNPAFDIACFWNPTRRATRLRVKTSSDGGAVWTVRKNGIFLGRQPPDDLVLICDVRNGIRGAVIYVVPTEIVEHHLARNHEHYVSVPGRHGKLRKPDTTFRVLRFFGNEREDNRSYGYQHKFARYREAWDQLR